MTESVSSVFAKDAQTSHKAPRSSVLHVCISCRALGSPRDPRENRTGFKLYQKLRTIFYESPLSLHVEVKPTKCLSLCPRPCGIALSSPGAWSYLFGDQHPDENARDILRCVSLYIGTADGLLPRERRPKPLRASILGRVPPLGEVQYDVLTNNRKQELST